MSAVLAHLPSLLSGMRLTLYLITLSTALSLAGGIVLAALRVSPVPILQTVSTAYVELFRNIPAPLVFFVVLFGLPQAGIRVGFFWAALIALSVYYAAFFCEAVRSGINAIPAGQAEAARSIGLGFTQSLRFVIIPQALRTVVPPLLNTFVALTKNTAVAGAFGVMELFASAAAVINEESQAVLYILLTTSVLYLLITVPAGLLANTIEKKAAVLR